jgi:pimeloyl-ACP methyl ester carboxylesterase
MNRMKFASFFHSLFAAVALILGTSAGAIARPPEVLYKTVVVGDLDIFYREAGSRDAPTLLLLHGFPTSSQMFRNLIPALANRYRVLAPDYLGFGHSSMPPRDEFAYTFDNLAGVVEEFTAILGLSRYALYVQDYGAPVGYRLACRHPDRVTAIVVQNGNAYDEGLDNDFWKPLKAYWQEPTSPEKRNALRATSRPPGGSTLTASRIPNSSRRTAGPRTSICWTARATTRSNSTCS